MTADPIEGLALSSGQHGCSFISQLMRCGCRNPRIWCGQLQEEGCEQVQDNGKPFFQQMSTTDEHMQPAPVP